jgi:hypothetical protein
MKTSTITQTILNGETYYKGFSIQKIEKTDRTIDHEQRKRYYVYRAYRRGIIDKVLPSKLEACNFIDNFITGLTSYHTLLTNNKGLLDNLLTDIEPINN